MGTGRARSALPIAALSLACLPANGQSISLAPHGLGLAASEAAALDDAIDSASWAEAESILLEATAVDPGDPARQRALGISHFQAGRIYAAAAALKRADNLSPLDAETRFLLSTAFLRLERQHWARAELEHLVERHADHERYRLALARIHYDQQRFRQGVELLSRGIEEHGGSIEAHDLLGQCLEGLGLHEQAAQAYRKSIRIGKASSPWPHFHLGSLLHDNGDLESAEEALRAATAIDPENGPAYKELGIVLRKAARLRASSDALEIASRLAPTDATIQYALAGVYRQLGLGERSAAAMRRFRELSVPGIPSKSGKPR